MAIKHAVVKAPLQTLAAVADWNANHTGDLNHGTELTNVLPDQHHAQSHNAASHSDIASTGAEIDDAVSKKHTQGTDTTLGAMTAVINMNTHQINNVVDPTLDQDAATKKYIDDLIPGVGTEYVSIPGVAFQENYYGDEWGRNDLDGDFRVTAVAGDWWCWAAIQIPHGAVVTGAIVYGADATNTWTLQRKTLTGGVAAMATAAVNTEDVTIANATINNSLYSYQFWVWIGTNDQIYGARVTYTI